jgi:hypothetical protein
MAAIPVSPPKVIPGSLNFGTVTVTEFYNSADSMYSGYNYVYSASMTIGLNTISDEFSSPNAFQWDANNVSTDMYFGTQTGTVYKVKSVTATSQTSLNIELIDQDLFILNTDPTQTGDNSPGEGSYGLFFKLDEEGQPDLGSLSNISTLYGLSSYWVDNVQGRFRARDYRQKYFAFNIQDTTNYTNIETGSFVFLSSSGIFYTASTGDDLERLFGIVQQKDIPEEGNMYVRPIAKIVEDLPLLPGSKGDILYYTSSAVNNFLTATKPEINPYPIYVKVTDTSAILLPNHPSNLATQPNIFYTGSLVLSDVDNIQFSGSGVEVTTSGSDGVLVDIKNDTLTSFYTGSEVLTEPTNKINFTGSGVEVTTSGSDGILVTIDGGGSGGTYTNLDPTPINFPSDDDPNIPSGTTFENKTFPEMMDLMLYPELDPTLTAPSNTFTISPSGLREIGEVLSTVTLSATFNRGSIDPAYGTDGFRSGLPNTYVYTGTGTSNNASTLLTDTETVSTYTVLSGANSWTGAVSYNAGPQPLTSKGNNFSSPLSAGTTSAITRTITGVYPTFATTSTIGTLTKQSLQVMTTYIQVSMVAETGNGDKQTIDIPDAWSTITGLQQFNTLSGTWDSISLSSFTTSATTQTIQGNSVNYTKYTYNGSTIGARQLRFTV